jgi:hypothetical protein
MKWASGWTGIASSLIFFKKFSFGGILGGLWITLCKTFDPIYCKSLICSVVWPTMVVNAVQSEKKY